MTSSPSVPVSQLAQELHLYWSLLEMAVRLERGWDERLSAMRTDAFQVALTLGRRIAGDDRTISTLADLRAFIAGKTQRTVELATVALTAASLDAARMSVARGMLDEAREIGSLLARGINIRECSCTDHRGARQELVGRLRGYPVSTALVDAPQEIARIACVEAARRLKTCIEVCAGPSRRHGTALH